MDDLAALRLQIEWGADEALLDTPSDRFAASGGVSVRLTAPGSAVPDPAGAKPLPASRSAAPPVRTASVAEAVALAQSAADLPALLAALDGFDACPLRATASTTVAPSGNPAAGLVLINDAPGPEDDRAGRAFSGEAGGRLDRILGSAGLSRDRLLLVHLVPWRPPGGRPVNEVEYALCLPFLQRLLALVRPRHLVLLGAGPLRAMGDAEANLRKARGKWADMAVPGLDGAVPALTMLPPDLWLSSPASKQSVWSDLLTLSEAVDAAG